VGLLGGLGVGQQGAGQRDQTPWDPRSCSRPGRSRRRTPGEYRRLRRTSGGSATAPRPCRRSPMSWWSLGDSALSSPSRASTSKRLATASAVAPSSPIESSALAVKFPPPTPTGRLSSVRPLAMAAFMRPPTRRPSSITPASWPSENRSIPSPRNPAPQPNPMGPRRRCPWGPTSPGWAPRAQEQLLRLALSGRGAGPAGARHHGDGVLDDIRQPARDRALPAFEVHGVSPGCVVRVCRWKGVDRRQDAQSPWHG
jgi:hypothetical protein